MSVLWAQQLTGKELKEVGGGGGAKIAKQHKKKLMKTPGGGFVLVLV